MADQPWDPTDGEQLSESWGFLLTTLGFFAVMAAGLCLVAWRITAEVTGTPPGALKMVAFGLTLAGAALALGGTLMMVIPVLRQHRRDLEARG